ncbi:MAG: EndoU domain-containing protein [Verrucomicrobiae bacterium]|nr:EndoU domain-containing protein [Verrucomicrobiae bacterium]
MSEAYADEPGQVYQEDVSGELNLNAPGSGDVFTGWEEGGGVKVVSEFAASKQSTPVSDTGLYPQGEAAEVWVEGSASEVAHRRTYLILTSSTAFQAEPDWQGAGTVTFLLEPGLTGVGRVEAMTGAPPWVSVHNGRLWVEPPVQEGMKNVVRLQPLEFEYVELLEDGSLVPLDAMPVSDPAPTVEVSNFDAEIASQTVAPETGEQHFEVTVNLAGTLDDALSDITPGSEGVVNRLYLIINEEEWIPLNFAHSKQQSGPLGHKQYDYTGTFSDSVIVTTAVEGVNSAKVLAVGPSGNEGYSLHTFTIKSTFDAVGTTVVDFQFEGPVSPTVVDSLTVFHAGEDFAAWETEVDSGRFQWTDSYGTSREIDIDLAIVSSLSNSDADTITARVSSLTENGSALELEVEETGANTLRFQADLFATEQAFRVSDVSFVERSDPGPFHPTMLRLKETHGIFVDEDWLLEVEFTSTSKLAGPSDPGYESPSWTEAAAQTRSFITRPNSEDEHLYLNDASGENPAVIVAMPPHADSGWLSPVVAPLEEFKKRFENPDTFDQGIGNGLVMNGLDVISDGLRLIEWGGEKGSTYVNAAIKDGTGGVKAAWDQDWQTLVDIGARAMELAAIAGKFVGADAETREDWILLLNLAAKGDSASPEATSAIYRLGSKYSESFSTAAEIWAYASEAVQSLPKPQQGLVLGQLIGEIVAMFVPATKASKLSKAKGMTKLSGGKFSHTSKGGAVFVRIANFMESILTTKMCFIAGTMVMSAQGAVPIEAVRPGMEVWARDEFTKAEGWKPVRQTFTTHPEELFTLGYDTDGDGAADEEVTGTGEHPFWVEDLGHFLPMRGLRQGMRLSLAREGGTSIVTGIVSKRRPPGERFTTYNFEVEDFHTYFVGESGVWVHNTGRTCQELFSVYFRFLQKNGGDPRAAYSSIITRMPNIAETFLPKAYKQMGKDVKALEGKFDLATPDRRTHILYGDGPGSGGHLFPGQPGKSVFPESWDADKVMAEISELVSDEALEWTQVTGAAGANLTKKGNAIRWKVEGVRDGVTIRAIIEPRGEGIITAFPID